MGQGPTLELLPPPLLCASDALNSLVSVSGDTAIVGSFRPAIARVFQRDRGGKDMWGMVATVKPSGATGEVRALSVDGDLAVLAEAAVRSSDPTIVSVFARNQGGQDAWGEAARILVDPPAGGATPPESVAISADTLMFGDALTSARLRTPIEVYVADTDRDGFRDGIDPCPRDPLNNVAGGCGRNTGAYPVVDDLFTPGAVDVEAQARPFAIHATFTNTSDVAIGNPFFEVTELSGGNELVNADAGPGGVGATLSADVGDGILSPGESVTATFLIRLATRDPFSFQVSIKGETGP